MKYLFLVLIIFLLIFLLKYIINYQLNIKIKKKFEDSGYVCIKQTRNIFILKREEKELLVYLLKVPSNSCITINDKTTWCLRWGGAKNKLGKSYPNMRYLSKLTSFLNKETDDQQQKVIIVYPETEKMMRYINECEMIIVNSGDKCFDYLIIEYDDLTKKIIEII